MPKRDVRQPPGHGADRMALGPAATAPRIRASNAALDQRPTRLHVLADGHEPELVQATEGGQVGRGEGSVEHVEVFRVDGVGTSIIGRPRPLPEDRRAHPRRTLNCEEPVSAGRCTASLICVPVTWHFE